jgi:hypothetical protein
MLSGMVTDQHDLNRLGEARWEHKGRNFQSTPPIHNNISVKMIMMDDGGGGYRLTWYPNQGGEARYIRGCIQNFGTESITKQTTEAINTRWEATQRVVAAKLTRLTHKIAIQLHLVAESVLFVILAAGGQFGNLWIHPRTRGEEGERHQKKSALNTTSKSRPCPWSTIQHRPFRLPTFHFVNQPKKKKKFNRFPRKRYKPTWIQRQNTN